MKRLIWAVAISVLTIGVEVASASGGGGGDDIDFPPSQDGYADGDMQGIGDVLRHRVSVSPFNLVATLLFVSAIVLIIRPFSWEGPCFFWGSLRPPLRIRIGSTSSRHCWWRSS